MKITDCSLTRSAIMVGAYTFRMEIGGNVFEGTFDDFGGFVTMVRDMATFYAVRAGKLKAKDANATRQMAENPH